MPSICLCVLYLVSVLGPIYAQQSLLTDIVNSLLYYSKGNSTNGTVRDEPHITDPEVYLRQYGYLEVTPLGKSVDDESIEKRRKAFTKAVSDFQEVAGLNQTGLLDEPTRTAMLAPRCGVRDIDDLGRTGRFKWTRKRLTWKLSEKTNQLKEGYQRRAMKEAFTLWSDVTPLEFVEVNPASPADITIMFSRKTHGDAYPFDGAGSVLAHAFYPQDGRCHFDDDELWVYNDEEKSRQYKYKDLVKVATHEIGHVLGLSHSKDYEAIMGPIYQYFKPEEEVKTTLKHDDIVRIQSLYGVGTKSHQTTPASIPSGTLWTSFGRQSTTGIRVETVKPRIVTMSPPAPPPHPPLPATRPPTASGCPWVAIDSIETAPGPHGRTYIFQGDNYWTFQDDRLNRNMRLVSEHFPGGPRNIRHAVVDNHGHFYLISDHQVWAYRYRSGPDRFELSKEHPKPLADDVIKFNPDLAFRWTDGNVIFVKDGNFKIYSFSRSRTIFEGLSSNYFPGIPHHATEGFLDKNKHLWFHLEDGIHEYDTQSKSLGPPVLVDKFFLC